ncbi:MFS transporter [Alsobacter sp. SYSU BS001988]
MAVVRDARGERRQPVRPAPSSGVPARLYAARAVRDFGDGFVAVLSPVYLTVLGLGALEIGVVATAALLGSAATTLAIGWLGGRHDQRALLVMASALMGATGLAVMGAETFPVFLVIAFAGTANPSAGSVSIFVPLEHAALSHAVQDEERTAAFARYSLVGALAGALGGFAAAAPDAMASLGVSTLTALKAMFFAYAGLGLVAALIYRGMPSAAAGEPRKASAPLGPSKGVVYRLAAVFCIDSFAGGFAVQSLLALWLFNRFGLSLSQAGFFFLWSGVLAAFSFPVASWLAGRIGLVNTMVFTHIPSSLCLVGAALSPNLDLALALLLVRSALSQMDVPTRSSYVMAVVTPPERAAAASVTSVPRSLASAASPALAGALYAAGYEAWPFVICGTLKIAYDLLLLWMFRHVRPPEES